MFSVLTDVLFIISAMIACQQAAGRASKREQLDKKLLSKPVSEARPFAELVGMPVGNCPGRRLYFVCGDHHGTA